MMAVCRKLSVTLLFMLLYPLVQIPTEDLLLHEWFLAEYPSSSMILERELKTYEGGKSTFGLFILYDLGGMVTHCFFKAVKLLLQWKSFLPGCPATAEPLNEEYFTLLQRRSCAEWYGALKNPLFHVLIEMSSFSLFWFIVRQKALG